MKSIIALVTGGYSGEAVISYKSAITIEKNIDAKLFEVYKIDIGADRWVHETQNGVKIDVDRGDFTIAVNNKKVQFDAVMIGIHGTPGEDGKLQGYFDLLNLPYTSCNAAISALTFNKRHTVAVAAFAGISVARSILLNRNQFVNADEIINNLLFPVFVKPNNGGSSIGMSRVNHPSEQLEMAIQKAFNEDDQVLVEEFIDGREFTIGVFQHRGKIITLPFTEIKTKKEFFDFEAKYTPGLSEEITPAQVEESIATTVTATAKKIYQIFNCKGVVRIDFIYNEQQNKLYMLEINTVPGQTEESLVPKQVKAMGWTLKEFYTVLLQSALANTTE